METVSFWKGLLFSALLDVKGKVRGSHTSQIPQLKNNQLNKPRGIHVFFAQLFRREGLKSGNY